MDQVRDAIRSSLRAFVLGPGVVDPWETQYGHSNDTFSPPEYGSYIATSNGVYVCSKLRADTLSSLPLKLYRVMRDGKKIEVEKGNLYALLQKVNPFWTMSRLLNVSELSLCLWGETFWFLERGKSGKQPPKEIWWGRPDRVTVIPHPTDYISGFTYNPENGSPPIPFLPNEVVWLRYPNPIDEYKGLSPLAAARLAADTSSAAMQANAGIFKNGLMPSGMVFPKQENVTWSKEQADELEKLLDKRHKGQDKAHRLAVFRTQFDIRNTDLTPKDAEFLGMLKWGLEDICRAYGIPLDLVGGERTYENVAAAERALYVRTIQPESQFIASELTEQLLPMFPGEADLAGFDLSEVEVLHEAETAKWGRASDKIAKGAITINEWRDEEGLERVPWGDSWWAPISLMPISAKKPALAAEEVQEELPEETPEETAPAAERTTRAIVRSVEYGSPEHERVWSRYTAQTSKWEEKFAAKVRDLFKRQKASVLARLKERGKRQDELADNPFNKAQWTKTFRVEARPLLEAIVADFGAAALSTLALENEFDTSTANVMRMIERQAQRFAKQVNETTWEALRSSLAEGVGGGESVPQLAERVTQIMDGRIESSAETIARTEVIGASNGGTMEAWDQSGVVAGREWISALDERTRTPPASEFDHYGAHGEIVDAGEDFTATGEALAYPGDPMGSPGNVINCRCSVAPVLDIDRAAQAAGQRAIVRAEVLPAGGMDMRPEDWMRMLEAFARSVQPQGITVRADNFTATVPEIRQPEIKFEPQIIVNVPPQAVPEIIIQVPQAAPPDVRVDIPAIPVTVQQELRMPPEETTAEVVERDASGRVTKIKRTKKLG